MAAQEDTRIDVSVEKLMGVAEKVRRITGPAKQQWMNLRHNESCVSIEKLFDDMENVVKSAKKETQRQQNVKPDLSGPGITRTHSNDSFQRGSMDLCDKIAEA
ncbi:hypothetical protein DPMN_143492 [Dreissena polymorpha]|uniref:Uncharacterized protein n=1 Tax=Dreissena polymorpha TaxID=45954 RepID=A0A9D4GDS9_DREPO|nr:hypothetical protein DPMN_143492 [Dreissena polymorpha]